MLCTATPDISTSSENINSTARVSRLSPFLMTMAYSNIGSYFIIELLDFEKFVTYFLKNKIIIIS